MMPVMRARRDLTAKSGDIGTAGAFAKHLAQDGFKVSREVDPQYLDIITRELGPDGINVNAVAFGWIETRSTQEARGETAVEIDGGFHMEVEHWEDDMARQRRLSRPGVLIVRCSARELREEPDTVVEDLRALGLRSRVPHDAA